MRSPSSKLFVFARTKSSVFECSDLPDLLVAAVIGKHDSRHTLGAYAQISKGFQSSVKSAMEMWSAEYENVKSEYLKAVLDNSRQDIIYSRMYNTRKMLDGAMGVGFSRLFGGSAWLASKYSEITYRAMLKRRCVLCSEQMSVTQTKCNDAVIPIAPVSFAFAHTKCQAKHIICLEGSEFAAGSKCISADWCSEKERDVLAAVVRFHDAWPIGCDMLSRLSDFTKVVAWSEPSDVSTHFLWLWPNDAVASRDTLMYAFGVDTVAAGICIEKARAERDRLLCLQQRTTQYESVMVHKITESRRVDLRVALGRPRRLKRWGSLKEIHAFHPNMLDVVERGATARSALKTMACIRALERSIGKPGLCRSTIDYFLGPVVKLTESACAVAASGPTWKQKRFSTLVESVDKLSVVDFEVHSVVARPAQSVYKSLHSNMQRGEHVVTCTTRWPRGHIKEVYKLDEATIWLSRAELAQHSIFLATVPTETDGEDAMKAYLQCMVAAALKSNACRHIAFQVGGLHLALETAYRLPK